MLVRRRVKDSLAVAGTSNENQQPALHFIDHSDKVKLWEYAVLVAHTDYSIEAIGQLHRDRAEQQFGGNSSDASERPFSSFMRLMNCAFLNEYFC